MDISHKEVSRLASDFPWRLSGPIYFYEEILPSEALAKFKEILDFKKANMDRVILLLGNHDIHYFDKDLNSSRKDKENYEKIHQIFSENLSLFKLAMTVSTEEKDFLFTHAGVGWDWLRFRMPEVNAYDLDDICSSLNDKLSTEEDFHDFVINGLMDVFSFTLGQCQISVTCLG